MQVFGLFTVVATATGCLYFLDQDDVAKDKGLTAAGWLLLILNIVFVVVAALLIMKRGRETVRKWASWGQHKGAAVLKIFPKAPSWGALPYRRGSSSTMSNTGRRSSSVQLGLLPLVP